MNKFKLTLSVGLIIAFQTAFAQEMPAAPELPAVPEMPAAPEVPAAPELPTAPAGIAAPVGIAAPALPMAQDDLPKNIITVDIGPTIYGLLIGISGDMMNQDGFEISGLGFAFQYERQLLERVSSAARFAYLGIDATMKSEESDANVTASLGMSLSAFAFEGHGRVYPFKGSFFLDAMAGYANMSTSFSGSAITTDKSTNQKEVEEVSVSASRSYLKVGGKLGWRVDFGRPGGIVFEPAFGWYHPAAKFGEPFGKQLTKKLAGDMDDIDELDDIFAIFEDYFFVGGPRVSISLGWRF
jgi:hypothetical protein